MPAKLTRRCSYQVELAVAANEAAVGLAACPHCKAVYKIVGALAARESLALRALEEIAEIDCAGGKVARKHLFIMFPPEWRTGNVGHHD